MILFVWMQPWILCIKRLKTDCISMVSKHYAQGLSLCISVWHLSFIRHTHERDLIHFGGETQTLSTAVPAGTDAFCLVLPGWGKKKKNNSLQSGASLSHIGESLTTNRKTKTETRCTVGCLHIFICWCMHIFKKSLMFFHYRWREYTWALSLLTV